MIYMLTFPSDMIYHRFRKPFDYNTALIDPAYNLDTVKVRSMLSRSQRCSSKAKCRSFNYKKEKGGGLCQANSRSFRELAYSTPLLRSPVSVTTRAIMMVSYLPIYLSIYLAIYLSIYLSI